MYQDCKPAPGRNSYFASQSRSRNFIHSRCALINPSRALEPLRLTSSWVYAALRCCSDCSSLSSSHRSESCDVPSWKHRGFCATVAVDSMTNANPQVQVNRFIYSSLICCRSTDKIVNGAADMSGLFLGVRFGPNLAI